MIEPDRKQSALSAEPFPTGLLLPLRPVADAQILESWQVRGEFILSLLRKDGDLSISLLSADGAREFGRWSLNSPSSARHQSFDTKYYDVDVVPSAGMGSVSFSFKERGAGAVCRRLSGLGAVSDCTVRFELNSASRSIEKGATVFMKSDYLRPGEVRVSPQAHP